MLDRMLAAGGEPHWDPELTLRAAQVTSARRRQALAEGFERVIRDAHRPARWTCAAPLDRSAVRAAAPLLGALAAGLTDARAAPQGIALADQLLRDPGSPLYAPGDEEALSECARIACNALD